MYMFFFFQKKTKVQNLIKTMHDLSNQIETTHIEIQTFENIRRREIGAIPKRMEVDLEILLFTL